MSSRLIRVVACVRISVLFKVEWYSIVWRYHILLFCSSVWVVATLRVLWIMLLWTLCTNPSHFYGFHLDIIFPQSQFWCPYLGLGICPLCSHDILCVHIRFVRLYHNCWLRSSACLLPPLDLMGFLRAGDSASLVVHLALRTQVALSTPWKGIYGPGLHHTLVTQLDRWYQRM